MFRLNEKVQYNEEYFKQLSPDSRVKDQVGVIKYFDNTKHIHVDLDNGLRLISLESWLERPRIKVLDDGFVKLVDVMGSDDAIVQAARVSYGAGTKKVSEDEGLIRYLMRHRHTTPFEMVEFKFLIRVPMDCWRQFVRHRTASINEYSTRYSEAIDSAQRVTEWRKQSVTNKQGSEIGSLGFPPTLELQEFEVTTPEEYLSKQEDNFLQEARRIYEERLSCGVAREQARKDLPLSTYTEAYWKIDLHNLFHFLSLRLDSHAQLEIRQYAETIYSLIKPHVPLACKAFKDYRLDSLTLTGPEIEKLKKLIEGYPLMPDDHFTNKREQQEFESKLKSLGLKI